MGAMKKTLIAATALLLVLASCSPGGTYPGQNRHTADPEPQPEQHAHTWAVPELGTFHDLLSPVWHVAAPNNNWQRACRLAEDLASRAEALQHAALPPAYGAQRAHWESGIQNLIGKTRYFRGTCRRNVRSGDLVKELTPVHDAFHVLKAIFDTQ